MPQKRYYDYHATADDASENSIHYALHPKGVYRGMELHVTSSGDVEISPGYCLMNDGIVCRENAAFTLSFSPPSAPTNYTIVATHTNRQIIGGVPVEYSIVVGTIYSLLDPGFDGVVLGWIYHPGGATPLSDDFIVEAPKRASLYENTATGSLLPVERIAPIQPSFVSSIGPDLTFNAVEFDAGNFTLYQEIVSSPTAVGVQTAVQHLQFYVNDNTRPSSIELYCLVYTPATTKLDVEVYGTDQVLVPVTGGTILGDGTWKTETVTIDKSAGTFDDGKPYTVRLTYTLDPGNAVWVGRVKLVHWPYP